MADRRRDEERQGRAEPREQERERRIDWRADRYRGSDERGYGGGERLGRDWERREPRDADFYGRDERVRSYDEERFDRGGRGGEQRFSRGREELGYREAGRGREVRRYEDIDRERPDRDYGDFDRVGQRASPSGAFHEELREERERPRRYGDRTRPTSLQYDTDVWGPGTYGLGAGEPGETGGGRDYHRYGGDVGRTGPERGRYGMGTRGFGDVNRDDVSYRRERYSERRRQRDYQPRYGHGPGVENMEPPRLGYGTSTTRRGGEDHELGHGGYLGGTYRAGSPRPMGRAPKGYQRSDERIHENLCDRLMMSWMNAENVDIEVRNGEVTLKGTVQSRDEKRAIEALADSVLGVKDVHNELRVESGEQTPTGAEQRGEQLPLHS